MDGGVCVDDGGIVKLFLQRNEQGIREAKAKYGNYCYCIAYGILRNRQDAEECESDTYLAAWNVIPPQKPNLLATFLGKITRNLSLKRIRADSALKRGGSMAVISLEELLECIPAGESFEERLQVQELADLISVFLRGLSDTERQVFVCRYWYCDTVQEISARYLFTQSKVKMMLLRTREKLRDYLKKEGVFREEE